MLTKLGRLVAAAAFAFGASSVPAPAAYYGNPGPIDLTSPGLSSTQMDAVEAARRTGRAFVATATGASGTAGSSPTIAAGSTLNVMLSNPKGSGVRVIIIKRRFDNNAAYNANALAYGGISSPVLPSPTISYNGNPQISGGVQPTSSATTTFSANVSTTRLNNAAGTAVPTATGFLPTNSQDQSLVEWRIILPGATFGNYIVGQAAGLGSVSANLTYYWIEEPCGACTQ